MKTRLAIALVGLVLAGCNRDSGNPPGGPSGSGGRASSSSGGAGAVDGSASQSGGVSGSGGKIGGTIGGSGGAANDASQGEVGSSGSGGGTGTGGSLPASDGAAGAGGDSGGRHDAGSTDTPPNDADGAGGAHDADSMDIPVSPPDAGDAEAGDAADSGAPDAGMTAGDLKAAAGVLDGFAIVKPCPASFKPSGNANDGTTCEESADTENQHITKQFGGDASITYNVKLRIAGVSERYWYEGGTLDAISKLFYTGGLPTIHGPAANNNLRPGQGACKIHPPDTDNQYKLPFTVPTEIRPSDGCYNGFNIFAMTVSSPKQSYYLNYTTDFDNVDRQPHKTYMADYTVTIPISGQATLQFFTIDGDHHQVANNGSLKVPNVKTAQPFTGNFLEFTVVDVTRAN